ncbi:MAG: polysaccharide biosynthesis tyrosine autokinase, partial [Candidatus Omnitrophica bacterium]|nr:polysaccharide biosynthesis tyrosine autokinase [Candidatus Omnitrophota bacterium]
REFIYQDVERGSDTTQYSVSWLEKQLTDTLKELQKAEKDLNDFVKKNKVISVIDIESDKQSLIEALKSQKAQIEKEIAEISDRYKGKHPKMVALSTQLEKIKEQLEAETLTAIELHEIIGEYQVFKRKVDTYNSLYREILTRAKELSVSQELPISSIRVVDQAEEPTKPIRPRPFRDILIALVMSIFLAVAVCYFLESQDSTLRTSDDVEFYVKLPFLGYVSLADRAKNEEELTLVSNSDPQSMVTESFRNIRTSLLFSFPEDKPLNTIVVSSSIPGEGKSFVSANLAIVFAQLDEPTLIIDADMRKGRLIRSFKTEAKVGLSSLLTGTASLDEAIVPTKVANLSFLGTGPYAPNPTELLSSKKLKDFLDELKKRYKRIIIDSTPILSVSEAILLSDKCDGMIFVIRAASTQLIQVNEAKRILGGKTKIIGTILNAMELDQRHYHSYYYYRSSKAK